MSSMGDGDDDYNANMCVTSVGYFTRLDLDTGFNVHIQSKLIQYTFVVDVSSDLGQPVRPRQKRGFGLGK